MSPSKTLTDTAFTDIGMYTNTNDLPGKDRRDQGNFIGAGPVLEQLKNMKSVKRRRVGFVVEGPPAREGAEILAIEGDEKIGMLFCLIISCGYMV